MKPTWKCYCGHLNRMKFKDVRCIICRTECTVKEPGENVRLQETCDWLASDYSRLTKKCAVMLTAHTMNLINTLRA